MKHFISFTAVMLLMLMASSCSKSSKSTSISGHSLHGNISGDLLILDNVNYRIQYEGVIYDYIAFPIGGGTGSYDISITSGGSAITTALLTYGSGNQITLEMSVPLQVFQSVDYTGM